MELNGPITVTNNRREYPDALRGIETVICGCHGSPLDELLPLWRFSVEHIEVRVAEPVAQSRKHWPAPTSSLRKLNLQSHIAPLQTY